MQQIQSFAGLAPPPASSGQGRTPTAEPETPQGIFSQILGRALEGLTPRSRAEPNSQVAPVLGFPLGEIPSMLRMNPVDTELLGMTLRSTPTHEYPVPIQAHIGEETQSETQIHPESVDQLGTLAALGRQTPPDLATGTQVATTQHGLVSPHVSPQARSQASPELLSDSAPVEQFVQRAVAAMTNGQTKSLAKAQEVLLPAQMAGLVREAPASSLVTSYGTARPNTFQSIVSLLTRHQGDQTSPNSGGQSFGQQGYTPDQVTFASKEPPLVDGVVKAAGMPTLPSLSTQALIEPIGSALTPLPEADLSTSTRFIDTDHLLRQAHRFLKLALDGTKSELKMQLSPEHLGPLIVRLVVQDGVVNAHLTARDSAVRAMLDANLDQLKTKLNEQGLKVESLQVSVGSDSSYHQSRHSQQGGEQRFSPGGQPPTKRASTDPEPSLIEQASKIPSHYRTGGRFNGLA